MSRYISSFLGAFGSSSAEKAEAQQDEGKMEDAKPESAPRLETQQEAPESPLLESQAAFQSPAEVLDFSSRVASAGEPESQQLLATQPVEPFHRSPAAVVHFHPAPPLPPPRIFNSADEAAACAIPAPTDLNVHRLRSISKLFTALPAKPLPTYTQMIIDQMEYLMHVILLDTNPSRVRQHQKNLSAALETFSRLPNGKELMRSGRLHSRIQLTSVAADVVLLRVDDDDDEGDKDGDTEDGVIRRASEMSSDDWNTVQEQLIYVKGIMLLQNANTAVDGGVVPAPASDFPDEHLAKHVMMTVDFEEVILLIAVHRELANLRERLEEISDLKETYSEASLSLLTPGRSPSTSKERSINKAVEKALNMYMENLSQIFPPNEPPTAEDDDLFDGIEIDETSDTSNDPLGNVPKELTSFVLTDLYSPIVGMVDRLLMHLQSITSDTDTPALTQPGLFSYANVQNKMRALLTKWSESILDIPTLVRLGYGGVPSPIVDKDEDDVSSWGGDEDLEEDSEHAQERRRNISRTKSLTRILNAAMRGRSVSVTEEEKDIIAQLAAAAAASRPSQRSSSNSAEFATRERASKGKAAASKTPKTAPSRSQVPGATSTVPPEALLDHRKDPSPQAQSVREVVLAEMAGRAEPSSRCDAPVSQNPSDGSRHTQTQTDSAASTHEKASAVLVVARAEVPIIAASYVDSDSVVGSRRVAAPYVNSDSDVKGKRVVKEGRRVMSSLVKAKPHKSGLDDEEFASRKPAAKRKRDDGETADASERGNDFSSDDSSVEVVRRPVKLRHHIWGSKERIKLLTDKKCPSGEDSFKENSKPSSKKKTTPRTERTQNQEETPEKRAIRSIWSDSEGESTPVGSAKEQCIALSPSKRYAFTQEETDAVREGVVVFGVGKWKEIQTSDARLRRRTAGQVKDKYRTMKKRGEI